MINRILVFLIAILSALVVYQHARISDLKLQENILAESFNRSLKKVVADERKKCASAKVDENLSRDDLYKRLLENGWIKD